MKIHYITAVVVMLGSFANQSEAAIVPVEQTMTAVAMKPYLSDEEKEAKAQAKEEARRKLEERRAALQADRERRKAERAEKKEQKKKGCDQCHD